MSSLSQHLRRSTQSACLGRSAHSNLRGSPPQPAICLESPPFHPPLISRTQISIYCRGSGGFLQKWWYDYVPFFTSKTLIISQCTLLLLKLIFCSPDLAWPNHSLFAEPHAVESGCPLPGCIRFPSLTTCLASHGTQFCRGRFVPQDQQEWSCDGSRQTHAGAAAAGHRILVDLFLKWHQVDEQVQNICQ
jgi:hypothetical protein